MKSFKLFETILVTILFSLASLSLEASVRLDSELENFLSNEHRAVQSINVIISYKNLSIKKDGLSRAEREKLIVSNNLNNQRLLFQRNPSFKKINVKNLWISNSSVLNLNRTQLLSLINDKSIASLVFADRKIKIQKETSLNFLRGENATWGLNKINVPQLHQKYPQLSGAGVKVGIIDTGIDNNHPDLKKVLKVYKNFSPTSNQLPSDGFGHGTHVAGTIAGSATSGLTIGIAPKVDLIVARIFDENGESTLEGILSAMQWMADPDLNPQTNDYPSIINNSWSDDASYKDKDPNEIEFCTAVNHWKELGIVPVFSAGNTGPNFGTINLPAACPNALSVAATEINDRSPWFSSSGPATWKSIELIKPEVSAPGMDVESAKSGGGYEVLSGTSMAAPHASGTLAIISQAHPDYNADKLIKALIDGTKDLGDNGKDNVFGFGRIDVLKSVELQ